MPATGIPIRVPSFFVGIPGASREKDAGVATVE